MNVELTDQTVPKIADADVDIDTGNHDLSPLAADRAADGTRSKLTAAPPPIPTSARRPNTLPPPIPSRAARGSVAPRITKVGVVEPRATPEMMASWQINPEGPLRPSGSIPLPPPVPVKAPATVLPTTIELVRGPVPAEVVAAPPVVTGNAPSVVTQSSTALPVVQQEIIPSPRESRVTQLPTSQPGADVADLPVWPMAPAKAMGEVLATRTSSSKLPAPMRGRTTLPPPLPAAELRAPRVPTLDAPSVLVAPEMVAKNVSALDGSDGWVFEDDYEERHVDGEVVPTTYFERTEQPPQRSKAKYLIAAGAAAVIAVIGFGALSSSSPERATPVAVTPAPAAAPAVPVPAVPMVAATPPVAVQRALTTLPITSWPDGATVTLVDNGNATVLGRTPVSAALDPSHSYDVVLAVVGRPTVIKHVDFATMHELAIDLDPEPKSIVIKKAVVAAAPAPRAIHHAIAPGPQLATPDFDATPAAPAHHHHHQTPVVAAAAPQQVAMAEGTGVLMISAKPPCEIIIDGKPTKLTTPQRSISLSPGAHAVTLINATIGIRKTIAVKVDAKKPTKLIQDFTKS